MTFPLVPLIFHSFWCKAPRCFFAPRARKFMHAHAHADNLFDEEISAEACSGKEIAGLLKKMMMMMMMNNDDR